MTNKMKRKKNCLLLYFWPVLNSWVHSYMVSIGRTDKNRRYWMIERRCVACTSNYSNVYPWVDIIYYHAIIVFIDNIQIAARIESNTARIGKSIRITTGLSKSYVRDWCAKCPQIYTIWTPLSAHIDLIRWTRRKTLLIRLLFIKILTFDSIEDLCLK